MFWHELLQLRERGHLFNHPKVFGFEITLFYSSSSILFYGVFQRPALFFLSNAIEHPILITVILRGNRNGLAFGKVFGVVPSMEKKTSSCSITKMLWAMNQRADLFRSLPLHSDRTKPTQHKFSTYKSCKNHLLEGNNFHVSSPKVGWPICVQSSHLMAPRIFI